MGKSERNEKSPAVGNPRKYRRVYDSVCVYSVEEWKDESGNHKSF